MRIKFIQKIIDKIRKKKQNNINIINILETVLYYIPNSSVIRPFMYSPIETIRELQNTNKSFVRFGDGEILLINKNSIPFQQYDKDLSEKLKQIIKNEQKDLMVGINFHYFYPQDYNPCLISEISKEIYIKEVPKYRCKLLELIDIKHKYYSSDLYIDKYKKEVFEESRKIWDSKEIVIVNCKNAIKNIEYDIYDNAKKIDYIYISNKNCYSDTNFVYNEIEKHGKDKLYILQAGPSAKVWAAELALKGFRVLDLGHLQKQYDYYKKGIDITKSENVKKMYAPDEE